LKRLGWGCLLLGLVFSGCGGSADNDEDGASGGTAGTGASAGKGGSSPGTGGTSATAGKGGKGGAAGSGTAPIPGGPFPFPQNKTSGMCSITTYANASAAVQSVYTYWKTNFVVAAGSGLRVLFNNEGQTVSEGVAYGMLIAVYMNDRPAFDGFWTYAKAHPSPFGFMSWKINADGTTATNPNGSLANGSAADADEDMAWALIMASAQWQYGGYLDDAKRLINGMATYMIAADGMLLPGDSWGSTDQTFPDYFSPAYFRVFAEISGNRNWSGAILDKNYEILAAVSGMHGLVPDSTTRTYMHNGAYGYDACRTPWRIAMDYCFHGEPRAKAYLDKVVPFFAAQGVANIGDGYSLTGTKTSSYPNMAFIGPAGVGAMYDARFSMLLNDAFTYGATGTGGTTPYYQQTLRMITMLMMSGNFLDFTKQ
jgi:endo-1,4-beta-D-glucanase Y